MLPIRLHLFGIIGKVFGFIWLCIYKVLSVFNLQPLLFVGILGVLAEVIFGNVFTGGGSVVFGLAITGAVLYAVIKTTSNVTNVFTRLFSGNKKKNQPDDDDDEDDYEPEKPTPEKKKPKKSFYKEKPKYYKVRQNPNYIMAEYSDRYELFKIVNGKLVYIRTDSKE